MTTNTEDTLTDAELIEWLDDPKGMATSPITRAEARVICHQAAARIRSLQGEVEKLKEQLRPGSPTERAPTQWAYDQACTALRTRHDELSEARELLERARKAMVLLYQNAEGCAVNHFAQDFAEQGLPGWLHDMYQEIEAVSEYLSRTPTHEQSEKEKVS